MRECLFAYCEREHHSGVGCNASCTMHLCEALLQDDDTLVHLVNLYTYVSSCSKRHSH